MRNLPNGPRLNHPTTFPQGTPVANAES
jgi:hypothetical protein